MDEKYQDLQHQSTLENAPLQSAQQHYSLDPLLINKQKQETFSVNVSHLNQSFQESVLGPEKQNSRKLSETKLRYKKIKQKLTSLSQQILDQNLVKQQKDVTSPNKSRLQKLTIQLDKAIRMQAVDYQLIQSILKEIQKIVEHKRQHDILILRGAKAMTTLIAIIKRFPYLHRTEAAQSMISMELSLRLLRIMLTLPSSRQLLLMSNQLAAISSVLSCALMRQQKKLSTSCLYLLNMIFSGPTRYELHQIVKANLQYILCSSLLKRLKVFLQSCITEDDPAYCQFILLGFKFYYFVLTRCCQKELCRPIYGVSVMDNLSRSISGYFQSGIQLLIFSIVELLFQRQTQSEQAYILREQQIPNFKINILLYVFKSLNAIFHVNISYAQKILQLNNQFMKALSFIFHYVKDNFKESSEIKNLCSQIIVFIGNMANQNQPMQNCIRESGLLESFCNHPLQYHMEPLKHIYLPALCSLIHQNQQNFKEAFQENSVLGILQYIQKQLSSSFEKKEDEPCIQLGVPINSQCKTLSRKTSVSSMNSTYSTYSKTSMAQSFSTQGSSTGVWTKQKRLDYKFRQQYWQGMVCELKKIED